ncbi:MAG: glycosyltransferase family 2 protein, partial [Flavobacteriia bacterium]|nr:glycosyltransferase family 2 protein [Flavobacteriia bacterium]
MALSIIIVNYNVAYFLEQCLNSVFQSKGIQAFEVIVVDNRSSDNSVAMIRQKFPQVQLIINQENLGFSKANNQGIEISKGEFVVLLNPDTVVEESSFEKTLAAFQSDAKIGGVGVRMAGPGKRPEPDPGRQRHPLDRLAVTPGELLDEVLDQQRDVGGPVPQRGDRDRHHLEPMVEVAAEAARGDRLLQVAVGGG